MNNNSRRQFVTEICDGFNKEIEFDPNGSFS